MLKPTIFREYDIRGIVGREFDSRDAEIIGKAFGTLIQELSGKDIIVGSDNRFTSDEISAFYIKGLLSTGCNVTNAGLTLRPVLQTAVRAEQYNGGTMITGSHNPPEYNGFKFMVQQGLPLFGENIERLKELCFSKKFKDVAKGNMSYTELTPLYLRKKKPHFNFKNKLKIIIDCGNAPSAIVAPQLFQDLGADVTCLFCDLDGSFPNHIPDPAERVNTLDLSEKVKETGADLGIAFDTDGDRFGIIDEKGNAHESDRTLVLLAKAILQKYPGTKILYDIKSSRILETEIKKAGGQPIMMRTGHPFFQDRMKKDPEIHLGGELSGHTMYRENHCFDDGLFAATKLTELASQADKPLSNLYQELPETYHTPEIKAACPDEDKFRIVKDAQKYYRKNYEVFEDDGIRIEFSETAWGLIRASHTTPALSLRFEADHKKELKKIMKNVKNTLQEYPEVNLEQFELFL